MTTNQMAEANHQSFSSAYFNALAAAMSEASGSPWLVAAVPDAESVPDGSEPVRFTLALGGSLSGEFQLEFRRGDAAMLASKLLGQGVDEFGTKQSESLLELIKAGSSHFQAAVAPEYGEFTLAASLASGPAPNSAHVLQVTVGDDGSNRMSIRMHLTPVLTEALTLHSQTETATASDENPGKNGLGKAISEGVNLGMVMDVELNVTLRFGQRQLTLREVLDLTSGSVVELDRQVDEPVELLLDGVLIARGEAVVVDGNYGLRVTEVTQPVDASVLARR
jgi:flagellar motor switch protein FliN/FliY